MKSLNRSSAAPAPRTGTTPRTGMSRRLLTTGALLCIGIMPLSACSLFNPPLERDESVHAIFDAEQDIVKMPLDDYSHYEGGTHYEYTAFKIAMKQCYAEHGQSYTDPDQAPQSESAPSGDPGRKYGPWNVEYAKKYGYSQKESRSPEDSASDDINTRCQEEVKAAFSDVELDEKEYRFVGELNSQAYTYASQTDEWKNIRSEWWTCLRERGLTPREGESDWMSEESAHFMASSQGNEETKPEEIRLATIEAECNQKVGMAQRLGDLEASYQGPLIEKNQAKLNQLKAEKEKRVAKAREIIATHQ